MAKRTKAALSGEEMLELYKNNKIDENFNNPESLQNLLEYQTELIASGKSGDTDVLTLCSDKLFDIEEHKAPDVKRLFAHIRVIAIIILGAEIITLATVGVCKALGIDFFANIFLRSGETTMVYTIADNSNPLVVSDSEIYDMYGNEEGDIDVQSDDYEIEENTEDSIVDSNVYSNEDTVAMTKDELIESYKPKWLPDGYELIDTCIEENAGTISYNFYYENYDNAINIFAIKGKSDFVFKNNNDGNYYKKYEYADVTHIISSNNGILNACWQDENLVFEIIANGIDEDTLKRIINSYYQEEK